MRENIFILAAILFTWLAIFFIVPFMGFDIKMWGLILSATIGGLFAGLLVLPGETVIENIILVIVLLVISGVVSGENANLRFIFITALLAAVIGTMINLINQYITNNMLKK